MMNHQHHHQNQQPHEQSMLHSSHTAHNDHHLPQATIQDQSNLIIPITSLHYSYANQYNTSALVQPTKRHNNNNLIMPQHMNQHIHQASQLGQHAPISQTNSPGPRATMASHHGQNMNYEVAYGQQSPGLDVATPDHLLHSNAHLTSIHHHLHHHHQQQHNHHQDPTAMAASHSAPLRHPIDDLHYDDQQQQQQLLGTNQSFSDDYLCEQANTDYPYQQPQHFSTAYSDLTEYDVHYIATANVTADHNSHFTSGQQQAYDYDTVVVGTRAVTNTTNSLMTQPVSQITHHQQSSHYVNNSNNTPNTGIDHHHNHNHHNNHNTNNYSNNDRQLQLVDSQYMYSPSSYYITDSEKTNTDNAVLDQVDEFQLYANQCLLDDSQSFMSSIYHEPNHHQQHPAPPGPPPAPPTSHHNIQPVIRSCPASVSHDNISTWLVDQQAYQSQANVDASASQEQNNHHHHHHHHHHQQDQRQQQQPVIDSLNREKLTCPSNQIGNEPRLTGPMRQLANPINDLQANNRKNSTQTDQNLTPDTPTFLGHKRSLSHFEEKNCRNANVSAEQRAGTGDCAGDVSKGPHVDQQVVAMSSSAILSQEWLDEICEHLIEHMERFGICVIDNFLGPVKGDLILNEVQQLYCNGHYTKGRLVNNKLTNNENGTNSDRAENIMGTIRNDRVIWVDGYEDGCGEIHNLIQTLCSVITNCSRMSLCSNNCLDKIVLNKRTKAHVSCYPGNGTKYIKHVDNPNGDGRVITSIYYPNKSWDTKRDGGLLRMFPAEMDEVANIEPLFDRVLFFWSDRRNPHEVLPAYRNRYAITVWYIADSSSDNQLKQQQQQQ